jgi:hypothetical protein
MDYTQAKVSLENREYGEEVGRLKVARDLAREVMDVATKSKAQVRCAVVCWSFPLLNTGGASSPVAFPIRFTAGSGTLSPCPLLTILLACIQIKLDMREVENFLKEVEARFTKAERENVVR